MDEKKIETLLLNSQTPELGADLEAKLLRLISGAEKQSQNPVLENSKTSWKLLALPIFATVAALALIVFKFTVTVPTRVDMTENPNHDIMEDLSYYRYAGLRDGKILLRNALKQEPMDMELSPDKEYLGLKVTSVSPEIVVFENQSKDRVVLYRAHHLGE